MTAVGHAASAEDPDGRTLLESGLSSLGLKLDPRQVQALLDFAALLRHWGRTYNLTAIQAPRDIVTHHLLDCLAVVTPMQQALVGRRGRRLLDVGSGAGLPGLVLAMADPTVEVVCVDSVGKKTAFVAQALAHLRIANARVVHGRVEKVELGDFDAIVSRAFASLPDFVRSTERLLHPRGVWLAMKGKVPMDEIARMPAACTVHVEPLQVPALDGERCLIRVERRHHLPESERTPLSRDASTQDHQFTNR